MCLPVALFAAHGWLEKNALYALGAFGLVLWRVVQALVFERIAEDDLRALTSWLFDRPGDTRIAQIALVGRQGCTRADCSALRKELSAARQVLEHAGIPRSRLGWEGLSDQLARGTPKLESDDDMLRLAVLGGLPRVQDRLAARAAELRGAPLGVVYEWLRTGRVDEAELTRVAASLDPEHDWMQNFDAPEPWLLFATRNPRAHAAEADAQGAQARPPQARVGRRRRLRRACVPNDGGGGAPLGRGDLPIPIQGKWLGSVVRGYLAYHGVPTSIKAMQAFQCGP